MDIQINGISYQYISDFPSGWLQKSHDDYKCPVRLGNHHLFVKRFENLPLAFGMLRKYKDGLQVNGIPAIHAFVYSAKEQCFYLFQEYINAEELKQRLEGVLAFDLKSYAATMYDALNFLHEEGFWHTDFVEENIMIDTDKNFYLIDVDSCLPLSEVSSNDNIKGGNFSADVLFNLKRLKDDFDFGDIDGKQLNILQLIFSIIHFYNFTHNRQQYSYWKFKKSYTSDNLISLLPFIDDLLVKALSFELSYDEVKRVLDYLKSEKGTIVLLTDQPSDRYADAVSSEPPQEEEIKIDKQLLAPPNVKMAPPAVPPRRKPAIQSWEINGQKRSRFTIEKGEEYTLSWTALNANYVELDGLLLPANPPIQYLISTENKTHHLFAVNKSDQEELRSEAVLIRVKVIPRTPKRTDPCLIYFEVDGHSSNFRVLPNTKVTIKWKVVNVDQVIVNNIVNQPQGKFTKVLNTPYVFTLDAEGISRQVIKVGLHKKKITQPPQIQSFLINGLESEKIISVPNEKMNVSWETAFAEKVILYYDGTELLSDEINPQSGLFSLPENSRGGKKRQSKELKLLALSEEGNVVHTKQIIVQSEKNNHLLIIFLLLLLIAALILILQLNF
ncbi:MAG: hypothetical protein MI974_06365 [Chitinophagales bacterium]|nr:hypothetical protein [Chitinophagales bacterium]